MEYIGCRFGSAAVKSIQVVRGKDPTVLLLLLLLDGFGVDGQHETDPRSRLRQLAPSSLGPGPAPRPVPQCDRRPSAHSQPSYAYTLLSWEHASTGDTRGVNDARLRDGAARTRQPSVQHSDGAQVLRESIRGTGGWLWIYLIGSVPLTAIYSIGLSGWFFDYPVPLMAAIFLLLATPLVLILLKFQRAPQWNIAVLWIIVVLMTLRSLNVFVLPYGSEGQAPSGGEELLTMVLTLSAIISVSLGWAILWTRYFMRSVRVKNTSSTGSPAGT